MKLFAAIVFLALLGAALPGQSWPQGGEKKELVGKPEAVRDADRVFWRLVDQAGEEMELLGAPYEFEDKNRLAGQCIENAIDTDRQIRITGVWKKNGKAMLLDTTTAQCQPVASPKDCPEKRLGSRKVTGIYAGLECGDFCHIIIRQPDGRTFSGLADREQVAKLFGDKPGASVSAVFDLEQMWINDGGPADTRPNAPGWCQVNAVFTGGKKSR